MSCCEPHLYLFSLFPMLIPPYFLNIGTVFDAKERKVFAVALAKLVGSPNVFDHMEELWTKLVEKFVAIQDSPTISLVASIELENDYFEEASLANGMSTSRLKMLSSNYMSKASDSLPEPQVCLAEALKFLKGQKPRVSLVLNSCSPIAIEYIRLLSSKYSLQLG